MPHPIFQAVLAGQYQDGLKVHAALPEPTATDDRWGGYCLFALGQLWPARDLLLRARARGCEAASLELALVLRYLGEPEAARQLLLSLPLDRLSPVDRSYAHREHASLHLMDGRPLLALAELEAAWSDLLTAGPDGETLRQSTAQLLGYVSALLGREAAALHYLNLALGTAQGGKRVHALHTRAQVALYAARFEAAGQDLAEAAALLQSEPVSAAYHAYLQGLLARAQGHWEVALGAFAQAFSRARATGESSTEALAALGQASVLTLQGQWAEAHTALLRADALSSNAWQSALVGLRRGAWQVAQGQPEGAVTLLGARERFEALGLRRETAWCDLHLCAAHLANPPQARQALTRVLDTRAALGSGAPLLPELRLLPQVTDFLLAHPDDPAAQTLLRDRRLAHPREPLRLTLQTLGRGALLLDGQEVRVGLRRTPEVLAYLLLRGPATREQVLATLWSDDDPRRAANYFHQLRHELTQHVPWLSIDLTRTSGLYSVTCRGPEFNMDAAQLQHRLSTLSEDEVVGAIFAYTGPFLPEATAAWADEEREALEWSVIRAGLQLMQQWSQKGEYSKCAGLSRRLLDIAPCDEALVEYLVVATLHLEGRLAAQRALLEASTRAQKELSEAPMWTSRLERQLLSVH
ncbi:transcriptional regulator, SARP family protein [Deinococcus sp. HMF7604]|uniref:BTAD domain-containing putative transcriptional regulator n=1 Tax=Deinococcus betulae TaxID=2873312 RepID=UPI001CCDF938|nr:BTAD domain-containing putative transcriptional regulator [Deinococcus betulae]MBZ9750141.1 transcriptional regulator, SARP family protein [Deinococcus betulae]